MSLPILRGPTPQVGAIQPRPPQPALSAPVDELDDVLRLLHNAGLIVAPHVAEHLCASLAGDAESIVQMAGVLSVAERTGARFLPEPLPLVPAVAEQFAADALDDCERRVLLAATLCTDDRLDVLLEATGTTIDGIRASALGSWLTLAPDRFLFADPRIAIWAFAQSSAAERADVHARIAQVQWERGNPDAALWHESIARASMDSECAERFLAAAEELAASDRPSRAFIVAHAVAARSDGELRARAQFVAGRVALGAGCIDDAADCIEDAFAEASSALRAEAAASLVMATFLRDGATPTPPRAAHVSNAGQRTERRNWCRAAALIAVLAAGRGDRAEARASLPIVGATAREDDSLHELRDLATAWTWLLLGDAVPEHVCTSDTPSTLILSALQAGAAGDPAEGIRRLTAPGRFSNTGQDPLLPGLEHSPLVNAHRAVALALLWFWQGDLRRAYRVMSDAASRHPVALAFGGLGVALVRRLEVDINGRGGPLAQALTGVVGGSVWLDHHVDHGIRAYLAGDIEEASLELSLWHDRGAPRGPFALPGLDEVGPLAAPAGVEPPDATLARALRRRVRESADADLDAVAEEGKGIRSLFERARLESMLGSAHLRRSRHREALKHLRLAEGLFAEAGAQAWRRAAQARLAAAAAALSGSMTPAPAVDRAARTTDPLAVCRAEWEVLLSPRELQVAMLMAEGATNRDIAERLMISVRTVEVHSGRLFTKLGVRTRLELVILAFRTDRFV